MYYSFVKTIVRIHSHEYIVIISKEVAFADNFTILQLPEKSAKSENFGIYYDCPAHLYGETT